VLQMGVVLPLFHLLPHQKYLCGLQPIGRVAAREGNAADVLGVHLRRRCVIPARSTTLPL
jgi:hypothetical protein